MSLRALKRRLIGCAIVLGCLILLIGIAHAVLSSADPQRHKVFYMYQAYWLGWGCELAVQGHSSNNVKSLSRPPDDYSGVWRIWDEEGHLLSTHTYCNGKQVGGASFYYHPNGVKSREERGSRDQEGYVLMLWDVSGKKLAEGMYRDEKPIEGSFLIDGEIVEYRAGKPLPPKVHISENNKKAENQKE